MIVRERILLFETLRSSAPINLPIVYGMPQKASPFLFLYYKVHLDRHNNTAAKLQYIFHNSKKNIQILTDFFPNGKVSSYNSSYYCFDSYCNGICILSVAHDAYLPLPFFGLWAHAADRGALYIEGGGDSLVIIVKVILHNEKTYCDMERFLHFHFLS